MGRSWIERFAPHALLLFVAVIALSLVPSATRQSSEATASQTEPVRAQHLVQPPGSTDTFDELEARRNLQEVMRRARIKYLRSKQLADDEREQVEQTADRPVRPEDTHRRMVRHRDAQRLPEAPNQADRAYIEYVPVRDPLAFDVPEELPQRDYVVMAFGELGGAEPPRTRDSAAATTQASADTPVLTDLGSVASAEPTGPAASGQPADTAAPIPTVETLTVVSAQPRVQPVQAVASLSTSRPAVSIPQTTESTAAHAAPQRQPFDHDQAQDRQEAPRPAAPSRAPLREARETPGREMHVSLPTPTIKRLADADRPADAPVPEELPDVAGQPTHTPAAVAKHTPAPTKKTDPRELVVLVDDPHALGSSRLDAIDNAVRQINQAASQANIDIALSLSTDKMVGHSILLREEASDALNGKLGLARHAAITDEFGREQRLGQDAAHLGGQAVASLNSDANWYTGDDDAIGEDQYDYQTAVMHELLHLVGLDDDFSDDSNDLVMHGYLSPGETRRVIDSAEKYELQTLYSSANLWRSFDEKTDRFANKLSQGIRYGIEALTAAPVPEPASAALIGMGLPVVLRRRRQ